MKAVDCLRSVGAEGSIVEGEFPVGMGRQLPATHWASVPQITPFASVPLLTHVPDWQASPVVQLLPSLHDVPSPAIGLEQAPVEGLQVPAEWHSS
jgi:hypothetical protein